MNAIRTTIAAAALAAAVAAQNPAAPTQPLLFVSTDFHAPMSVPGIAGQLSLRPDVIVPFQKGSPIIDQIEALRLRHPSLVDTPLVYQVMFGDDDGQIRYTPALVLPAAGDQPEANDTAILVDETPAEPTFVVEPVEELEVQDPETFVPMPTPDADEQAPTSSSPDDHVFESYDIATGRVSTTATAPEMLAQLAEVVAGSSDAATGTTEAQLMMIDNFGLMSRINNATTFPWRVNCKIYMTFPNGGNYVGSGTLIDSRHVLTAGHCVQDRNLGGWATSVRVVPAFNGDASGAARQPFGDSRAVQLHSWTGWTQSRNFSHDIGVIDLGRPVGALTGWFGYGYNTACSFFTTPTHHNASYPAESPFNGRRMFYDYGDFDWCPNGREARWWRRAYKGESGSGVYKFLNGGRYLFSVVSHRHGNSSDAVRLTGTKFSHVRSWLAADRPSRFDLTPLDVNAPSSVRRGNRLVGLDFLVHNYSKQAFSGRVWFQVYLSTNNYISTGDRRLGTWYSNSNIGSLGSRRIDFGSTGPLVPANTAPGTYYVGVILTTADANGGNQRSLALDVQRVRVNY